MKIHFLIQPFRDAWVHRPTSCRPFSQWVLLAGLVGIQALSRAGGLPGFGPSAIDPATTDRSIRLLKASGHYESLSAAVAVARYGVRLGDADHAFASNPAHGLHSSFTPEGLNLEVRAPGAVRRVGWRLESLGYGADQTLVPAGQLSVQGQRVELSRPALNLTEWFQNEPGGLEQGFTLLRRPEAGRGRGALRLVLAVTGDLAPSVDPAGQNLSLRDAAGNSVLSYRKLKVWDSEGSELPAEMQVADGRLTLAVADEGARYPLTIDPVFGQEAYVKASNAGAGDLFGYSVAISGNTVVVGAVGESGGQAGVNGLQTDDSLPTSGAAYVFVRDATTWTQQAYLKAGHPGFSDRFGTSVAISGDTIVVGAVWESGSSSGINGVETDDSLALAGAAYVFVRTGTVWKQQAYLKASNPGEGDQFGISVAIDGNTVVVGAAGEDSPATGVNGIQTESDLQNGDSGAAYVFVRTGTSWKQEAYLKAGNSGELDQFGAAVAVSGDTVVVGAAGEDSSANGVNGDSSGNSADGSGAAYVFHRTGSRWSQQAYLKASNSGAGDHFGISVAASGESVAVGAYNEGSNAVGINPGRVAEANDGTPGAGAVYVFARNGSTWAQQAYIKGGHPQTNANFGNAVSLSGETLAVGAWLQDSRGPAIVQSNGSVLSPPVDSGAVFVFARKNGIWSQETYHEAGNAGVGDGFGVSVAVSGETVVVGAFGEDSSFSGVQPGKLAEADNGAESAGAAYFLRRGAGDSDGDGLLDVWEREGGGVDLDDDGVIDLDLFALGARPDHKDLFVEIDCAPLPMDPRALARVVQAFDKAPVQNPDGTTGIHLHLEVDETGIIVEPGITDPRELPIQFKPTKAKHFGTVAQRKTSPTATPSRDQILAAKARVYRYCLIQFLVDFGAFQSEAYNGIGEIGGNDSVVYLGAPTLNDGFRDLDDQAATLMHELGHNLGLRHGGGEDSVVDHRVKSFHGKPNYPSIMNYVLTHPQPTLQNKLFWKLDYSREELRELDESSLSETVGIPSVHYRKFVMPFGVGPEGTRSIRLVRLNGSATDFNGDGLIERSAVVGDLNFMGPDTPLSGVDLPTPGQVFRGHNDWENLQYEVIDDNREASFDITVAEGCPSTDLLAFLEANVPADPESFEGWQERNRGLGVRNGFGDDPDGDGIPNGLERFLGTDPALADLGRVLQIQGKGSSFRHTRSAMPGEDAVARYEWSTDLVRWHGSGDVSGGVSVTLPATLVAGGEGAGATETVEVTPVLTGTPPALFYRLRLELLQFE